MPIAPRKAIIRPDRKLLETPEHKPEDYGAVYPRASTGRRLALAHWIASRSNPLTARVAVNHIWLRHFNAPLVDSVADFGLRAPEPLHRDVLDFLAIRFMEEGWSMKALHRRIVLSRAYRRTSSSRAADPETLRLDPDNRQLWRMNPRRIESQLVRDNLLHIGGRLDRTLGGPSVPADRPSQRRSIYFRHSRDDLHSFLAQFDDADFLQCYRRAESIVPQQALALSNSALTLATARSLADLHQDRSEGEYIDFLFRTVLSRPPEDDEATACREFLQTADQRRFLLAHALLNHNDFVTVR